MKKPQMAFGLLKVPGVKGRDGGGLGRFALKIKHIGFVVLEC